MKTDDICLLFRYSNEDENIDRFINNNLNFCSCFIALDDRSASDDVYFRLFNHPKCAAIIKKKHGFTDMYDNLDKEALHAIAISTKKPWTLILDIDEILDANFQHEMLTIPSMYKSVEFSFAYMYPDTTHCINEGIYKYGTRWFKCLFKTQEFLHYPIHKSARLHLKRYPDQSSGEITVQSTFSPVYRAEYPVYHFSMDTPEKRQQRFDFYLTYDPSNEFQTLGYDHILQTFNYEEMIPNIL